MAKSALVSLSNIPDVFKKRKKQQFLPFSLKNLTKFKKSANVNY